MGVWGGGKSDAAITAVDVDVVVVAVVVGGDGGGVVLDDRVVETAPS